MIVLCCDSILYEIGADTILEDISFSINDGDRLGVVGVNGAGKSTLLRLITGEIAPSGGSVFRAHGKSMRMLGQNEALSVDKPVRDEMLGCYPELLELEGHIAALEAQMRENLPGAAERFALEHERFVAMGGYEFRGRCVGILRSLGFSDGDLDLRVSSLSGGQKTRLALGKILFLRPDILILDEPTNHLDTDALEWLEDYLLNYRKTVIVVSHDRYFLDRVATKILDVENRHARLWSGNYSEFCEKKRLDREIQARHFEAQQKEISRIEAMIDQQRRWGQEHNFITIASKERQIAHIERVAAPDRLPTGIRMELDSGRESGNEVVIIDSLSKAYDEKKLLSKLSLLVKKRDRLFIVGPNGCGKSTLLKIITGSVSADSGEARYGSGVRVGYYDQENQGLCPDNTVLDELWTSYGRLTQTEVRKALALFRFTGDDVGKSVSVLSGGERARLTLAKLVLSDSNLLILDEPTNHLDIGTREALESALEEYNGTIVAVSHDRYFISKLANRMLDFGFPGGPAVFDGDYEDYTRERGKYRFEEAEREKKEEAVSASKQRYLDEKRAASEARKAERRQKLAVEEASKIEAEIDAIDSEMSGSAAFDHVRLTELCGKKEELEARLLELYEIIG